jgi:ribulose-phosphate 3-epimerase
MTIIAPSILSADFANLETEIRRVEEAGADWIHVDVMDGSFVPNLTIGAPVVKALKKISKLPLDVHLMITNPDKQIPDYIEAGADIITFHLEAYRYAHDGSQNYEANIPNSVYQKVLEKKFNKQEPFTNILEAWEASAESSASFDYLTIKDTIKLIKSKGVKAGLSINPSTPVNFLEPIIDELDLVLFMSVNPGFGGQKFKASVIEKIKELKNFSGNNPNLIIEVDGGVTPGEIASNLKNAGATALVAGSAIYGAQDMSKAISELKA